MIIDKDVKFFDGTEIPSGTSQVVWSDIVDLGGLPPVDPAAGTPGVSGLGLDYGHIHVVVQLESPMNAGTVELYGDTALDGSGSMGSPFKVADLLQTTGSQSIYEADVSAFRNRTFRFLQCKVTSTNTAANKVKLGTFLLETPHNSGAVI